MRFVPRIGEHSFEIDFFFAKGTDLLLADDAPTADAKLVESMSARQSERPDRPGRGEKEEIEDQREGKKEKDSKKDRQTHGGKDWEVASAIISRQ